MTIKNIVDSQKKVQGIHDNLVKVQKILRESRPQFYDRFKGAEEEISLHNAISEFHRGLGQGIEVSELYLSMLEEIMSTTTVMFENN